jgi:hypothetical protein
VGSIPAGDDYIRKSARVVQKVRTEPEQHMADEVSYGEPSFFYPDDSETFAPARIRHFAESVLSAEAWFHSADELIAAMDLLEPHVERFWEHVRSLGVIVGQTSDAPSKHQASDVPSKHDLINQHMMLAGFAIENLCKGVSGWSVKSPRTGKGASRCFAKSLKSHDILNLVEQTGMPHSEHFRLNTLCDTEKFLLKRITEAVVWQGTLSERNFSRREPPICANGF